MPGHAKAGEQVDESAEIQVEPGPRFVSRGGEKLANALATFDIDVEGEDCLDVGASTGGFTDCLLQGGAARVCALVTCHDVDAFRSILEPEEERRSVPFKWMSRRILEGLQSAAHVACDSEATRPALVRLANIPGDRLSVVPNGSEVRRLAEADAAADAEAARLVGSAAA